MHLKTRERVLIIHQPEPVIERAQLLTQQYSITLKQAFEAIRLADERIFAATVVDILTSLLERKLNIDD